MEKKYQVFVSSTYEDLKEERLEIIQALLELRAIPVGMELFPAANESQWSLIQRAIEDCDYFIVVLGGRYGSIGPQGISYTEMEYRYALSQDKPILGFIHKDPNSLPVNRTESNPENLTKLKEFRDLVKTRMCKTWSNAVELGSTVSRSFINLTRDYPAVGWVKADKVIQEDAAKEILRLRKTIDELEANLKNITTSPPSGTGKLIQGEDTIDFIVTIYSSEFNIEKAGRAEFIDELQAKATVNNLFKSIAILLLSECPQSILAKNLRAHINEIAIQIFTDNHRERSIEKKIISANEIEKIFFQLRALGLIESTERKIYELNKISKTDLHWKVTKYGEKEISKLFALKK